MAMMASASSHADDVVGGEGGGVGNGLQGSKLIVAYLSRAFGLQLSDNEDILLADKEERQVVVVVLWLASVGPLIYIYHPSQRMKAALTAHDGW